MNEDQLYFIFTVGKWEDLPKYFNSRILADIQGNEPVIGIELDSLNYTQSFYYQVEEELKEFAMAISGRQRVSVDLKAGHAALHVAYQILDLLK